MSSTNTCNACPRTVIDRQVDCKGRHCITPFVSRCSDFDPFIPPFRFLYPCIWFRSRKVFDYVDAYKTLNYHIYCILKFPRAFSYILLMP